MSVSLDYEDEEGIVGAVLSHDSGISIGLHLAPELVAGLGGFAVLSITVDRDTEMNAWLDWLDRLEVSHGPLTPGHLGAYIEVLGPGGLSVRLRTDDPVDADDA